MIRKYIARVALAALVAGVVVTTTGTPPASAASASDFDPGNIISDAAFYDGGAMTATQIQQFLNAKVSACTSGYTCLKDYTQSTPTMAATEFCAAYSGSGSESAASIIANVGRACNISQRVLLVLLQKEQSLVTLPNPSPGRFTAATGFGCSDSAPCDPQYNGFFYQVYNAAKQFQRYAKYPTRYNYRAGQTNQILFHPNTACGSGPVFIVNKATAGLYNYTPYQPNGPALSNLYGTGNSCSSYGNRNFWRLYTDWFGLPSVGTNLVRTVTNGTVYLVAGTTKYPIGSMEVLGSLAPLGQIGYVSDAYLAGFATGPLAGGTYRSENGSIFILDRGYRLDFQSCDQLVDFGYSCSGSDYVQLTDAQVAAFSIGPTMTNLVGTVSGARYFIADGTRTEILDEASQTAAGIGGTLTVLTDQAVSRLTLNAPIAREDVLAAVRGSGDYALLANGGHRSVPAATAAAIGAATRSAGSLSAESISLRGADLGQLMALVKDGAGALNALTPQGRYLITGGAPAPAPSTATLPQAILDTYPVVGQIGPGSFIIGPSGGTVYAVMPTDIRPIASWEALLALSPGGVVSIITVDASLIASMPLGPVALTAGSLVRTPEHATVFFINGVTSRIAFSSFVYPSEAGFTGFGFTTGDRIDAYPLEPSVMTFGFTCGSDKYVAAGGSVHLVAPALASLYPMTYVALDTFTCASMKVTTPATHFIRTPEGTIWWLDGTTKRPVMSMSRLSELGGAEGWLNVHAWFAAQYTTGAPA